MRNALQDQLLKAGLARQSQVDQIARKQTRERHQRGAGATPSEAERLRAEKAERDRALQAERNAQAKAQELRAQARQIIEQQCLPAGEGQPYRFVDGQAIRSLDVSPETRAQLARGALLIVRLDEGYAIVPRSAGDKIASRDASLIVLDHGTGPAQAKADGTDDADDPYRHHVVPDDLIW